MNLAELSVTYQQKLQKLYDEEEIQSLFLLVVNHLLGYGKARYIIEKQTSLSEDVYLKFEEILLLISNGKPVQYVIGETEFYGLPFKVNPSVLIPRPETEELVDWILNDQEIIRQSGNVIDIGTGSGCIAISLKKHLSQAHVFAMDISKEALEIAKANALINQVEVDFIHEDILHPLSVDFPKFDIIVSNPPYITENEKQEMHQNVLAHEPHTALFVSNEQPLVFYEAIAEFAKKHLCNGGSLFFEINEYLGKQTIEMLTAKGFTDIILRKDMQGKDRMIKAVFNIV
ncbi:peptide chain release factor N(5)-glutamine methyltransferase [Pedobacter chitinilyticus]|uniref:Release factor glutamine methyltransferase n=1 Tax=Pedobacter chitinilyticus TaxID=2233776 RepID=A0A3S3STV4_9SPHI|nr:peptide chain release factor N(5)-glutamine methyltransferase [Pedobacter chitinilyticus]RWU10249.1 peptide chain release factor N(5)-glutamine methyltransferase [Pedobacter chitinilyticus]